MQEFLTDQKEIALWFETYVPPLQKTIKVPPIWVDGPVKSLFELTLTLGIEDFPIVPRQGWLALIALIDAGKCKLYGGLRRKIYPRMAPTSRAISIGNCPGDEFDSGE